MVVVLFRPALDRFVSETFAVAGAGFMRRGGTTLHNCAFLEDGNCLRTLCNQSSRGLIHYLEWQARREQRLMVKSGHPTATRTSFVRRLEPEIVTTRRNSNRCNLGCITVTSDKRSRDPIPKSRFYCKTPTPISTHIPIQASLMLQ